MSAEHLSRTRTGKIRIVVGVHDVHYRAETVYDIDSNLACLMGDHPDVDRLLDARSAVARANASAPAACSHAPDLPCPPEPDEPCTCALVIAPQYVVDAWPPRLMGHHPNRSAVFRRMPTS